MHASKGFRQGTRNKLKREVREKFKPSDYLREFKENEKVIIKPTPISQKGMPYPKFTGKIGTIIGKRGRAYLVLIKDKDKEKIADTTGWRFR